MAVIKGRIIKSIGGFYHVETPDNILICKARGVFRLRNLSPCVGDIVVINNEENNEFIITEVLERKNEIVRPPLSNLDMVFIVVSTTEPIPNTLILDKLIFVFEYRDIEPVIVFTKTDKKNIDKFIDIYKIAGFKTILVDNITNSGIDKVLQFAKGKISAFIGNSGVGKSSLLNNLLPEGKNIEIAEISKKLGRGKHTTRAVELYKLENNTYIADTPGFSTVDIYKYVEIPSENVILYFREMRDYSFKCQFKGCRHLREEGCEVIKMKDLGVISPTRYENYLKIYDDVKKYESNY